MRNWSRYWRTGLTMRHEESMSLNLELYSLKIIKVAAEEYSKFCKVNLSQSSGRAVCTFRSHDIPADLIALEFGNYLIELMQQGEQA